MKYKVLIFSFLALNLLSCMLQSQDNKEVKAIIKTEFGNIKIRLYNETPLHRDNFVKLIKSGFYNENNFHRVINKFMIQGGDVQADKSKSYKDSFEYTIPKEIVPKYFHKKGALAAARKGDQVNPNRESSGTQFYIVQGDKCTKDQLWQIEDQITKNNVLNTAIKYFREQEAKLKEQNSKIDHQKLQQEAIAYGEAQNKGKEFKFDENQTKTYLNIGGTPHLDGGYTIFGEVEEGLEIVDKIAAVKTLPGDKPEKEVKFSISLIK